MDAEGDLHLGLENYHHCAHTGVLSDGRNAHATNSPSHMCCTQRCVSVSAASHADTAGPHLISAAVFVLFCFFGMQMFQNYFVVCKCGRMEPADSCVSSCDESLSLPLLLGVFAALQMCVRPQTHIITSTTPCVIYFLLFIHFFVPLCLMLGGKKKLCLLRYLLETISKLPSFTKAEVIAYDLYSAYRTNGFLCGQTVASRLYSVAMTTGCSAICIRI